MSIDVFLACAVGVALPDQLPADGAWKRYEARGHTWFASEHVEQSWQLIVSLEDSADFKLPVGKTHVVALSLEGNSDKGYPLLEKTVDALTKTCNGVLLET